MVCLSWSTLIHFAMSAIPTIRAQMRRRRGAAAAAWALLQLIGAVAWAGVAGTHHDMRLFAAEEEQSVCAYCHVPHRAESEQGLFARGGTILQLGPVGNFCYTCHDGTVVPTALIEALDGSVGLDALAGSHGRVIERIEVVSAGLETQTSVFASGLVPIADAAAPPLLLDCNACHDPHSDQNPPFLKVPLERLCQACHSGRNGDGRGRWTTVDETGAENWAHPIGMPLADSGKDHVRGLPQELSFHGPDPVFDVQIPTVEELKSADVHWDTGGHLLGAGKEVGCVTCHSVHLPTEDLLVAAVATDPTEATCTGCHGATTGSQTPGVTPYYHPVFESSQPPYQHDHASHSDVSDPSVPVVGEIDLHVAVPEEWPLTERQELTCQTCHRVHRGISGQKCLREGPFAAVVICNECHGVDLEGYELTRTYTYNWHHPTGADDYTAGSPWKFPVELPWATGPERPGDLADGLQCVDCHTEWAKSAHNW